MESNPVPEVQVDKEAQILNSIITMLDGSLVYIKAPQHECNCNKESYDRTLQKLEMMAAQQQQTGKDLQDIVNDVRKSKEETSHKIDDLTRKFERLEALTKSDGFYAGWNLHHNVKIVDEYVAANDLLKILRKIKQIWYRTVDGDKGVLELFTSIKTYGVSKYERFPSGGEGDYYVNINSDNIHPDIIYIITETRNLKAMFLGHFDANGARTLNFHLNQQLYILMNKLTDTRYLDNRATFETKLNITWVGKDN